MTQNNTYLIDGYAIAQVEPVTILINGSGFGVSALVAFLAFTAWLISQEVNQ